MKKKLIKFSIFLFLIFPFSTQAAITNLEGLSEIDFETKQINEIDNSIDKKNENQFIEKNNNIITVKDRYVAFCDISKLNPQKQPVYLSIQENVKVAQTYLNVYAQDIVKESGRSSSAIANQFNFENKFDGTGFYNKAEKNCLSFRGESPQNSEVIDSLYEQVRFYFSYYSSYPDNLTNGIIPAFILSIISGVNYFITFVLLLTIGNIVYKVIMFGFQSEKIYENKKDLMNAIWYFVLVILIKIGIIGTFITFIGFEGLDLLKTLFWF